MEQIYRIMMVFIFLLISFRSYAQAPFNLELRVNPQAECEPQDPNSNNQFACCVKLARSIELDQQSFLHLKADKNLCLNPLLQELKFTLVNARPDGINVYELSYPSIEQTPFRSYSGRPTKFWIAINSYFAFPKQIFLANGVHPFIIAPLRIEQTMPDGSAKNTFAAELSTTLGWKYLSDMTLSERFERYDCSNQFQPNKICTDRIRTIEQTWLNQLTNALFKRKIENRKLVSGD